MAASEKTLIYRGDTLALQSLLSRKSLRTVSTPKDPNYVDLNDLLDLKLDDTRTVKVSFTGEANQLAIIKKEGSNSKDKIQTEHEGFPSAATDLLNKKCANEENLGNDKTEDHYSSFETACSSEVPQVNENFTDCHEFPVHDVVGQAEKTKTSPKERDELHSTDEYLSRKSDSDEEISVFILRNVTEDESHYITTHEIQLSELDHDADGDFGLGSSWDIEDDHQVYSFVDYASFDTDETLGAKESVSVEAQGKKSDANRGEAALSNTPENDPSSLEKVAQTQDGAGNQTGQIHLSIKATSRAINESSDAQEKENILYHSMHGGDMSCCVLKEGIKGDKVRDGAKCLIALPGRLHFGGRLKGKDIHDYSSGASSAMSDLDDADKEVRNLTARAFKSLAYPYFDAINFSTSSESSASEHGRGINRWSTFVDLKYGNMNVSTGANQNLVTHKSATSNFHFAKQRESKGITGLRLTSMRAPPVEIFALNGSLVNRKNASSTKKIELMGKLAQGQSSLIRLTETLNFRCNVKAGASASERCVKCTQNAEGSRSADEVTDSVPSAQSSESIKQSCNVGESMEDTHKKSIFASSLLKNVISKKMQFEQERKMERGEISEACHAPSPCFASHESDAHKDKSASKESKGLQRQSSKFSEADSDFTIVCLDELGDIVDSNSCDAKDDGRREEALTLAPETNLEPSNEAGFDTKKGAFEPSKSTLLPSQNSAFRSWRDGELEFPKERKNQQTRKSKVQTGHERDFHGDSMNSKKMSHLFVPSIQVISGERELEKPYAARDRGEREGGGGRNLRTDNTLYVSNTTRSIRTSKSPEIKISLRSVRDNKSDPFSIAKLLTPNIGCNAANPTKAADDSKCQALAAVFKSDPSDKVPHFMVRDIRDNKGKLQTPIHQVRDVRKLVKSSYHFVSLDKNENKSSSADGEHKATQKQNQYRNPASLSPIVIKCHSVNTNNNVKLSGNAAEPSKRKIADDILEDRSSPEIPIEGNKSVIAQIHKATGRTAPENSQQEGPTGLKSENWTPTKRPDKISETGEKKTDNKMAALEKLQAAVKTMEQLYVFDKNEWKRKTKPQPITDSHVLSLITSEEHGGTDDEQANADSVSVPITAMMRDSFMNPEKNLHSRQESAQAEIPVKREEKEGFKISHTPVACEERNGPKTFMHTGGSLNKNISSLTYNQKSSPASITSSIKGPQGHTSSPAHLHSKGLSTMSPKLPVSLKISQPKRIMEERERPNGNEAGFAPVQFISSADAENYLTIPVKPRATAAKQPTASVCDKIATYTLQEATGGQTRTASPPSQLGHGSDAKGDGESHQSPKRSSIVMETRSPDTPTATIYHHPLPITVQAAQPQVICFSPTVQPSPVPTDHFQATQRKMLLDPTTGNYYLVDTPIQPATRRLFDPETGQYVDVPMPPQPPMTPVPMPISPLALSPGAYAPTYMFYPGYMPTTVIPTRTIQSQLSLQSDVEAGDKTHSQTAQQGDGVYMESPYYMSSGKTLLTTPGVQHVTAGRAASGKQPVISITSQQGPRIIAPPSFDGTTMSFVVEHR